MPSHDKPNASSARACRTGGLILAGGRSSRFGAEKAAATYAGRAMMLHVADRMDCLEAIAASARPGSWAARQAARMGADVVHDKTELPSGPLTGILAGLDWANAQGFEFLATAPCDAPLLPDDVFSELLRRIDGAHAAFAATSTGDHPLCAVWRASLRDVLAKTLADGHPSVRGFLRRMSAVRVGFEDSRAFANANTRADLFLLEQR